MDDPKAQIVDRLRVLLDVVDVRKLPSEPALASAFGASRRAVSEALTRLESEGLVSRRQGAETTINREASRLQARFDQQVEFVETGWLSTPLGRSEPGIESPHRFPPSSLTELAWNQAHLRREAIPRSAGRSRPQRSVRRSAARRQDRNAVS